MSARTVGLAEPLANTTDQGLTGALVARQQVLNVGQAPIPARSVALMASRFFSNTGIIQVRLRQHALQPASQRILATSLYERKSEQTPRCGSYARRWW